MPQAPTVLLVEDDEVLCEMYRERFAHESFQTEIVRRGEDAEARLRKGGIDLVLLDIILPGMSGLDLLAWIRGRSDTVRLPVILLSALNTEEDKMRGRAYGADAYLAKSETTPEDVVAQVQQLLATKSQHSTRPAGSV